MSRTENSTYRQGSSSVLLGVHVLAQFEFCERAALLTWESESDDSGEESQAPHRLDYLPDYEEALIRERLESLMIRFWAFFVLLITGLVAGLLVFSRFGWGAGMVACCVVGPLLFWWLGVVSDVAILRSRLNAARRSSAREPNDQNPIEEVFNWWELRKAGFQVDRPPEPMRHSGRSLIGKPWRVLRKGDLRIPVFRKHRGERNVRDQHRIRIAAYCWLIEQCEGSRAPYGIVMCAGSYDVFVVPNSRANQSLFTRTLERALESFSRLRTGLACASTPSPASCRRCPFGAPRPIPSSTENKSRADTTPRPIHVSIGVGGREFHSECGDRFQWTPPHVDAR